MGTSACLPGPHRHPILWRGSQVEGSLPTEFAASASAGARPRLVELFGIIADGSPPLKVATFDGGLFDPKIHPFLENLAVGDGLLQQGIDLPLPGRRAL